ncbi:MAG: DEAD/DEAH box helicase, partial [Nitriliruptoraceae bacterium]
MTGGETFAAHLGFELDPFQVRAIDALQRGESVLVAAPTGAGKTVVGEFACQDAIDHAGRAFYTTPIKALSNQKYRELVARHGQDRVGLLTGDRAVNGDADIVVMTTEVLRNMIYERSRALDRLRHVVLDEVHYLADRSRGAVWEEVIIQLSSSVQLAALSATVSNAESFGRWLDEVRGGCTVIIEEKRPVPLCHHYFVNGRIHPTFRAGQKQGASAEHRDRASQALAGVPNPDVVMLERRARQRNRVSNRGRRQAPEVRLRWPSRVEVVEELARRTWLPAILFVFSRAGCDGAVEQLTRAGVRLTSSDERQQIAVIVDTMLADLPAADLEVLGFATWRAGLLDGLAAHHAGMVPAFKECVEVLFQRGLLKVVVATETLALGINMPARTVVIERLEKWNGDTHVMLTPGEYTQLTGRAGRRGIDQIGHAVVLHQRDIDFRSVAGLVGTRTYPLRSSFTPSYNMAVNLLRHHDLDQAHRLLGSSFAQFEADSRVTRKADRLRELEAGIEGYEPHLSCDEGDWSGYWAIRRELSDGERTAEHSRRATRDRSVREAIAGLQPGDVLGPGSHHAAGVVVGVQVSRSGTPLVQVVDLDGDLVRIGPREVREPPSIVDRVRLPGKGNPRQRDYRRDVAATLRRLDLREVDVTTESFDEGPVDREAIDALRARLREHSCHRCPDRREHEVWQYRTDELVDEADQLRGEIQRATGSLVRRFERIRDVLTQCGYLDGGPTADGLRLARIYSEVDLLVAESLRVGLLDELDEAELAAIAAVFVYESRSSDAPTGRRMPTARLEDTVVELESIAGGLRRLERASGLDPLRDLDPTFGEVTWRWATGADLDDAIGELELTGGDFVRNVKQVIDLLGQLSDAGSSGLRTTARSAMDALRRG